MHPDDDEEGINFTQVADFLKRHCINVMLLMFACSLLGYFATDYLPHFYKSRAVLSILSSYFQHPLVNDLISEVQEPSEMGSQRLSLLRLALNDGFLDTIGTTYHLYEHPADSALRPLDRELLLKKIEYFSVSPTSFQISMTAGDPHTAYDVEKDILAQMTFTLTERRYQILLRARDSIVKQAKLLKTTLGNTSAAQEETLDAQLATMEANLAALRTRFTESHPDVVRLRSQVRALSSRIHTMTPPPPAENVDDYTSVFLSPASHASTQEIFNDLLKKLSHLNIVLEMEKDRNTVSYLAEIEKPSVPIKPVFPNRLQLTLGGAVAGLLLGAMRAIYLELRDASRLTPDRALEAIGLELLGELPMPISSEAVLLLDGKSFPALPNLLKE